MKHLILPFGADGPILDKKDIVLRDFTAARILENLLENIAKETEYHVQQALLNCGVSLDNEKVQIEITENGVSVLIRSIN